MLENNDCSHADERQWSASIQWDGGDYYDASRWVSAIQISPDHWGMLMDDDYDAIYCTFGVDSSGYFVLAIGMY